MGQFLSFPFGFREHQPLTDSREDLTRNEQQDLPVSDLLQYSQTGLYYGPTFILDRSDPLPIPFFDAVEAEAQTNFLEGILQPQNQQSDSRFSANENSMLQPETKHVETVECSFNFIEAKLTQTEKDDNIVAYSLGVKYCSLVDITAGFTITTPIMPETAQQQGITEVYVLKSSDKGSFDIPAYSGTKIDALDCMLEFWPIEDPNAETINDQKLTVKMILQLKTLDVKLIERLFNVSFDFLIALILQIDGVQYSLHDIYGFASKGENSDPNNANEGSQNNIEEAVETSPDCVICLSEEKNTVVLPCRHMCLCDSCADVLKSQNNKCPICRQPFHSLLRLTQENAQNLPTTSRPAEGQTIIDID